MLDDTLFLFGEEGNIICISLNTSGFVLSEGVNVIV